MIRRPPRSTLFPYTTIYQVLVTNQQTYLAQTQRIDLQQNLRAGVTILPADFRELDPADGDILVMTATQIQIRAMRQLSFLCTPPVLGGGLGTTVSMTVRQTPFYGARVFDNSDSVLVFYEGNPGTRSDDTWIPAQLRNVTNPSPCAAGTPGYQLTVMPTWVAGAFNVAGAITNGSRSEEHTSELQSPCNLVCRLLLEKKKTNT